ncbi:MAG: tetratricopeptide repeat protein, partial [Methylococcales bacterium]
VLPKFDLSIESTPPSQLTVKSAASKESANNQALSLEGREELERQRLAVKRPSNITLDASSTLELETGDHIVADPVAEEVEKTQSESVLELPPQVETLVTKLDKIDNTAEASSKPDSLADVTEKETRVVDQDTIQSVLQTSGQHKKHSPYLWLGLLLLIALLACGWYLYSLTQPNYSNNTYESEELYLDDIVLDDTLVGSDNKIEKESLDNQQIKTGKEPEPIKTVVQEKSISLSENQGAASSSDFIIEPDQQSAIDYPKAVRVRVKHQQPAIFRTLNKAYKAYRNNDLANAELLYKQILRKQPSNIDALLGLGTVAEQYGYVQRAQVLFEKVLRLDGNQTIARNALIRLQKSQTPSETESRYKILQQKFPDNTQVYASLANLYASQQRWQEAQQAYFSAIEHSPNNADFHFNLAISLEHLRKKNIALRYYRQALQLAQNTPASFDKSVVEHRIQQLQGQ